MDLLVQSLGIPDGVVGWQMLQHTPESKFTQFTNDPVLKSDIAYFQKNAPKATTAKALLSDPRLASVALTAYGLQAQTNQTALMVKVLNSDPSSKTSFARQLTSPAFAQIAAAFGYGVPQVNATPAVASSANVSVDGMDGTNTVPSFSGTFGGVTLSNVNLSGATTRDQIAATLTQAFQKADGGASNIKVSVVGLELKFTDAAGRGTAANFSWGTPTADAAGNTVAVGSAKSQVAGIPAQPAVPALASESGVAIKGMNSGATNFQMFSGTFGGVSVKNVNLMGATSVQDMAHTLTAAFQKADGGKSDITVTVTSAGLEFRDGQGRGLASNFTWQSAGTASAGAPSTIQAGNVQQMNVGGSNVSSADFIKTVIQKYTDAQFQATVGNDSNTLRTALYAQQQLPKITNWYSVIADTNLAGMVQTVLGLPSSFGTVDVDQQNQILSSKMNIKDFQDPAKVKTFINKYVSISAAQNTSTSTTGNPALAILGLTSGSSTSGSFGLNLAGVSLSSGSAAALLLNT